MSITTNSIDYTAGGGFFSGILFTPWESSQSKHLSQPPLKVTDTKLAEAAVTVPLSPSYPSAASSTDTSPALSGTGSNSSQASPASSNSSIGSQKAAAMAPLVLTPPTAPKPQKPTLKKFTKACKEECQASIPLPMHKTLMCIHYLANKCRLSALQCNFAHGKHDLKVRELDGDKTILCSSEIPRPDFPPGRVFACPSITCSYGHISDRIQPFRILADANGTPYQDKVGRPVTEWLVTTVRNQITYPVCMISQTDAEKLNVDAILRDPAKPLPINFN